MTSSRRDLLGGLATAGVAGLAGCLGRLSGLGPGGSGDAEGLALPSLAVGGSPGGDVLVRPPDRVVLLDFFGTWCAPCKAQMRGLREVRERFDGSALAMRSITNESDRGAVRAFWRDHDGTWPVLLDPKLRADQAYGATNTPTLLVLAPDGSETWRHVGLARTARIVEAVETATQASGSAAESGGAADGAAD